eukprot:3127264-Amphidinium_carterae.1
MQLLEVSLRVVNCSLPLEVEEHASPASAAVLASEPLGTSASSDLIYTVPIKFAIERFTSSLVTGPLLVKDSLEALH